MRGIYTLQSSNSKPYPFVTAAAPLYSPVHCPPPQPTRLLPSSVSFSRRHASPSFAYRLLRSPPATRLLLPPLHLRPSIVSFGSPPSRSLSVAAPHLIRTPISFGSLPSNSFGRRAVSRSSPIVSFITQPRRSASSPTPFLHLGRGSSASGQDFASHFEEETMQKKKKQQRADMETEEGPQMDFRKMLKDIEFLGSSHMTWKERKELENKRVVALGGKPPKKQRLPLSVARVPMKRQKEREQKMEQERAIIGLFGGKFAGPKRPTVKRKPEDRVLKSTEGRFRNGVLDVKHMLHPTSSRDTGSDMHMGSKVGKKGKGKTNRGKKKGGKGGNKKRH